jgi:hypothetical protein
LLHYQKLLLLPYTKAVLGLRQKEAIDLLAVFNKALYAPPFKGKAPTTSP